MNIEKISKNQHWLDSSTMDDINLCYEFELPPANVLLIKRKKNKEMIFYKFFLANICNLYWDFLGGNLFHNIVVTEKTWVVFVSAFWRI